MERANGETEGGSDRGGRQHQCSDSIVVCAWLEKIKQPAEDPQCERSRPKNGLVYYYMSSRIFAAALGLVGQCVDGSEVYRWVGV